jgi:REP element-mobilizing transposase RayT
VTIPRSHLIDESRSGAYHLISRCVRRAFLCGDGVGHRRDWLREALVTQTKAFGIDLLAYAIMANHFHLVVRVDPARAETWTALQVAERWCALFPRVDRDGTPDPWSLAELNAMATNDAWVAERRARLMSVSWFMKLLKEGIARRANREDHCTGAFWEGRFTSVALLDEAAIAACMAYVDLNPIRARIAQRPETSDFTSIQDRVRSRQSHRRAHALAQRSASDTVPLPPHAEAALWIAPISRAVPWSDQTARLTLGWLTVDDYLTLVDQTGRIVRAGKRGAIPPGLRPILERLQLDVDAWVDAVMHGGRFRGSAVGSAAARAQEAVARGARWLVDKTRIHRTEPAA